MLCMALSFGVCRSMLDIILILFKLGLTEIPEGLKKRLCQNIKIFTSTNNLLKQVYRRFTKQNHIIILARML